MKGKEDNLIELKLQEIIVKETWRFHFHSELLHFPISCHVVILPLLSFHSHSFLNFSFPFMKWNLKVSLKIMSWSFCSFLCTFVFPLLFMVSLHFRIFCFSNFMSLYFLLCISISLHFSDFKNSFAFTKLNSSFREGKYNIAISTRINSAILGPFHRS